MPESSQFSSRQDFRGEAIGREECAIPCTFNSARDIEGALRFGRVTAKMLGFFLFVTQCSPARKLLANVVRIWRSVNISQRSQNSHLTWSHNPLPYGCG